jgi:hypothetical protein
MNLRGARTRPAFGGGQKSTVLLTPSCARGNDLPSQMVGGYKPPTQDEKVRVKKLANGRTKIVKVDAKKKEEKLTNEKAFDRETGKINWEVIKKTHKRKPCEKLLRQITGKKPLKKKKKGDSSDSDSD